MTDATDDRTDRSPGTERPEDAPSRPPVVDTHRLTRICYIVTVVYAGLGVSILVRSFVVGDRLGVCIGILGLGAALGAAFAARIALGLSADVSTVNRSLEDALARLARIEETGQTSAGSAPEPDATTLNLAALGRGEPWVLASATLDRSAFPRLVAAMEDEPPAEGVPPRARKSSAPRQETDDPGTPAGPTTTDLLESWDVARRSGNLPACRRIFAALVDTADVQTVASLGMQLQELHTEVEEFLRSAFSRHIREQDYAGALQVGEQICTIWPDEGIARDFERIKPILLRRVV